METIQITPDLRLSIEFDTYYEIEAAERGMSDEDVQRELNLIESDGVYIVVLQRKEVYTSESGKTLIVWEDIDSVGGNFLNDDYTAQDVAAEFFPDFPDIYR